MPKKEFTYIDPKDVLDYIIKYKMANGGQSPTLRQLCKAFKISVGWRMKSILENLAENGEIVLLEPYNGYRFVVIPGSKWTPPPGYRMEQV